MSRFENRKKIEVKESGEEVEVLKGSKIITGNSGKVEKNKKMFYLPKVLIRAIEITSFKQHKNESEICTLALQNYIPREYIEEAEKEDKTL